MKSIPLLPVTLIALSVFLLASCRPSRVWENKDQPETVRHHDPAPPVRAAGRVPLIIEPTRGFTMNRFPDGRYYHRGPGGWTYWKGYDNRFFIDPAHLSRIQYSRQEYREWKRFRDASRRYRPGR